MKTIIKTIVTSFCVLSSFFSIAQQFNVNQSGVWSTCTGSYTNLTDGDLTTGAGTSNTTDEWIKASFTSPQTITSVGVAGGNLNAWGPIANYYVNYINGAFIQSSTDDVNWTTQAIISGVTDSNGVNNFSVGSVTAQYWRLSKSGWLATTEFVFNSTVVTSINTNEQLSSNSMQLTTIFPNPTSDYFQYTINSSVDKEAKLKLIDVLGRTIIEKNIVVNQGTHTNHIDVSSISNGTYMLQVLANDGSYRSQKQVTVK